MSTPFHSAYWATLLSLRDATGSVESLSRSIANARLDLNPHQVDAALFAVRSPLSKGVVLADEVGLGKTIEAGLVIAQRWAERCRHVIVIVPATLRTQWQQELRDKFFLETVVLDAKSYNASRRQGVANPFDQDGRVVICSYHFAAANQTEIQRVPWSLAVIDEAHRLRNVYKPSSKLARAIADATANVQKLLLTATPLQNSLLELYGLASVIDPHLFGDAATFREQFVKEPDEQRRNGELRERLKPIVTRTLRKQVSEYVPFTRRLPITQDFFPTDEEQQLYDQVSAYLQRDILLALPRSQRTLITLVLRKLLASSTVAIAATLRRLADRLELASRESGLLEEEDYEGIDELEDELAEGDEQPPDEGEQRTIDAKQVRAEIAELRQFAASADGISLNAKAEALIPALNTALERATGLGARRKAVVFTESRRTQQFLFDLLSRRGFEGKVAMLNASNTDPKSTDIYKAWITANRDSPNVTGSRPIDVKAALVEHFRDDAEILVATEAAAEGINLQFCSLVVNFDLPWNPQRIEQRIGRCHRYGQKHDVVVVNFINRRNEADQRVFQLLSEKFRLFDGIFGASDEVLGALESGVDIERRIAEVYLTCRTHDEIAAAFDRLQGELDEQIQARLRETRSALLEHFDEDVRTRLRVHKDKTVENLSNRERWLLDLARFEVAGNAVFDGDRPRFEYRGPTAEGIRRGFYHLDWKEAERLGDTFFRQDHPLAARSIEQAINRPLTAASLTLDYTGSGTVISVLKPLVGRSGWLEVAKLSVDSFDTTEFIVFAGRVDAPRPGTLAEALDDEVCRKLLTLSATVVGDGGSTPDLSVIRQAQVELRVRQMDERSARLFDEEVLKLDRWSEDLKLGLERELKELDKQIVETRRSSALAASLHDKLEAQRTIKTLEATRNRKRRDLFEAQDGIDHQREELIKNIEAQLKQSHRVQTLFTVRWRLI